MNNSTLIFDVKRYAINDGPGVRITIFLKGCQLACKWCHNPESQNKKQQKFYSNTKCIACKECVKACANKALTLTNNGIVTNATLCDLNGRCADVCPTKAIEMTGELMTVEQVMTHIKRETLLMDTSEGGVTFSGGEPLLHHAFLIKLLDECVKEEIHSCIDTTGYANTEMLIEVAKRANHFLYDIKMMDSTKHREWTGVPNEKILKNLQVLATLGVDINIRIPLLEGINTDDKNIHETAQFIAALEGKSPLVNILPFHNIAEKKYEKLGQAYDKGNMSAPSAERQEAILKIFKSYGIKAMVGG